MALDRTRTLRGALAGAAAAAVWAAQQPLDQRVFGVRYDDVELLGRFVTDGRAAYPVGLAMHIANGAALRRRLRQRGPRASRPAAPARAAGGSRRAPRDLAGHGRALAHAPGRRASCRTCGARARAFAQATWRHLLFGTVLGELERRLNPPDSEPRPIDPAAAASNGHGHAEYVVSLN